MNTKSLCNCRTHVREGISETDNEFFVHKEKRGLCRGEKWFAENHVFYKMNWNFFTVYPFPGNFSNKSDVRTFSKVNFLKSLITSNTVSSIESYVTSLL